MLKAFDNPFFHNQQPPPNWWRFHICAHKQAPSSIFLIQIDSFSSWMEPQFSQATNHQSKIREKQDQHDDLWIELPYIYKFKNVVGRTVCYKISFGFNWSRVQGLFPSATRLLLIPPVRNISPRLQVSLATLWAFILAPWFQNLFLNQPKFLCENLTRGWTIPYKFSSLFRHCEVLRLPSHHFLTLNSISKQNLKVFIPYWR